MRWPMRNQAQIYDLPLKSFHRKAISCHIMQTARSEFTTARLGDIFECKENIMIKTRDFFVPKFGSCPGASLIFSKFLTLVSVDQPERPK